MISFLPDNLTNLPNPINRKPITELLRKFKFKADGYGYILTQNSGVRMIKARVLRRFWVNGNNCLNSYYDMFVSKQEIRPPLR
jgi:hypothetical protein